MHMTFNLIFPYQAGVDIRYVLRLSYQFGSSIGFKTDFLFVCTRFRPGTKLIQIWYYLMS
jgi:hypothetical protein